MRINPVIDELSPFSYCGLGYPIKLDANESCVPLPEEIAKEISQAVYNLAINRYPDDTTVDLRAAFSKAFDIDDANWVVPGNGSDELINMIVGRLIPYGGMVLGVEYDFGSYWSNAKIFGRNAVKIPRLDDMTFTAEAVIEKAKEINADVVIFSNPNNPSGSQLKREEVIGIIEALDCLVVVDEAYMDFSDQSVLDLAGKYKNLIVLRTLSKAMGAAGIRLGFAVTNSKLAEAMRCVRDAYNVSAVTQAIGKILLGHLEYREKTLQEIGEIMVFLKERLNDIKSKSKQKMIIYPSVTNFVLMKFEDAATVNDKLREKGISLRPLQNNLMRISVAPRQELSMVLDELEIILTQ